MQPRVPIAVRACPVLACALLAACAAPRPAASDWPAPLGYFVGYQIARALYDGAADKRAAVRTLLELRDPDAILAASGYTRRFAH